MSSLIQINEQVAASMWSYEDQYVLRTKLFLAPPRIPIVARPRLIEVLHASLRHPLTVIVAPAGSGKTTLLSDWFQTNQAPTAFLSLDGGDNDPTRFWTYVIVALENLQPQLKSIVRNMLHVVQQSPIESILTVVINTLCKLTQNSVLVLDDYHVITNPAIHNAMHFFFENLPPQLHVIIATRSTPPLPLAKLRVDGVLNEMTGDDLTFSDEEIHTFFAERTGLQLDQTTVAEFSARTEGWAAGLHLAALILKQTADVAACMDKFGGHHQMIADYLITEVLHQQPDDVQRFLLETAVLQRLNGSLCDTITGRTNSQCVLESIHQANLFLIPLDDERCWYRYHHLFAEALRERLQRQAPERIREIHLRASVWYAQEGDIAEAIHHALDSQVWEQAAHLIMMYGPQYCVQGKLQTVQHWLTAVPTDVLSKHPQLGLLQVWLPILMGHREAIVRVEEQLNDIEHSVSQHMRSTACFDPLMIQSEIAVIRACIALIHGDTQQAKHLCRVAGEVRQQNQQLWWYDTIIALNLGNAAFLQSDFETAHQSYTQALHASQITCNVPIELQTRYNLAIMAFFQGRLHSALAQFEDTLQCAKEYGMELVSTGCSSIMAGVVHYEWGNTDVAIDMLQQGIPTAEQTGDISIARFGCSFLARAQLMKQDLVAADTTFQHMCELVKSEERYIQKTFGAHQAQVWLAQGQFELAARWAQSCNFDMEDEMTYVNEFIYFTLARVWVVQRQLTEALPLLHRLRHYAETTGHMRRLLYVLVQEALVYYHQCDESRATQILAQAIHLAESEGYRQVFFDEGVAMYTLLKMIRQHREVSPYVEQLLATFPLNTAYTPQMNALIQSPLSNREQQVLRLLARGYTNDDIARELVLAESSIKTYLKRIYRKLGVQSRTQAIARGREWNML